MTMFYKQDETSPLQPGDVVKARIPGVKGARGVTCFTARVLAVSKDGSMVMVQLGQKSIKVRRKYLRKFYFNE